MRGRVRVLKSAESAPWPRITELHKTVSSRRATYRVGYPESSDGRQWERKPDPAGLDRSADGWDSVMLTYTSLLRVSGKMLYLYNGNGFGRAGFGYAVAEDSGGSQARAVA